MAQNPCVAQEAVAFVLKYHNANGGKDGYADEFVAIIKKGKIRMECIK